MISRFCSVRTSRAAARPSRVRALVSREALIGRIAPPAGSKGESRVSGLLNHPLAPELVALEKETQGLRVGSGRRGQGGDDEEIVGDPDVNGTVEWPTRSRCGFRLHLAVASRTYSKCSIGVGQLDPERGNANDCAVDEVLRRHSAQSALVGLHTGGLRCYGGASIS